MTPVGDSGPGDDLLLVGRVTKAQGIRGEVRAYTFSRSPDNFKRYTALFVRCPERGDCRRYAMQGCRSKGENVILALAGIATRSDAETLVGCELLIDRRDLTELRPGEYYWEDLIGRPVVTDSGQPLGVVSELFATGAHDVLVVHGREREYLIPVIDEYLTFTEDPQRTLVVTPVAGLLDMNEESAD